QIAGVLGVEDAFAVAEACDESACGLLAEDIAVRQTPLAHRLFDPLCETAGDGAEEAMAGVDDLARREPAVGRCRIGLRWVGGWRGWRRALGPGWGRTLGSAKSAQKNPGQDKADRGAHRLLH